jgi:GMP synthase (glutamine-hydrolysing)
VVLDAGGQYCHLIARKVRELGVTAEVFPSETPAGELRAARGIIISGGPSSVYEPESPRIDPALLSSLQPVLGICYGQQLIAHNLDGAVEKGDRGEYGLAHLEIVATDPLLDGVSGRQQVWMSHRDTVSAPPSGFTVTGRTETCAIASMSDPARKLYAVQFHPEVVHTHPGRQVLANFVFGIAGCKQDWDPAGRIEAIEQQIRETAGSRNVFFFVSGGVDSTVAFTLCLRALGPDRVHGTYVDTGFMREGETEFVREMFVKLGARRFEVVSAESQFLSALTGITDPEEKRMVIGAKFVEVQERILESEHFLDGHWILGQGTIYPDTIESGGTKKADKIKTHHNRVEGIQKLIDSNRILEPLTQFYKDEVREIGARLDIPPDLLERHPFPGPGLAIRCLCSDSEAAPAQCPEGWVVPVHSVGVQGDSRTYRPVLALEEFPASPEIAADLVNRVADVNRVVAVAASREPLRFLKVRPAFLSANRLHRLRRADAAVRRLSHAAGFDATVWQFPVVLLPLGTDTHPDTVVLRPIESVDGMTARSVVMDGALLESISRELLDQEGIAAVLYDLTNKPPATIEWE